MMILAGDGRKMTTDIVAAEHDKIKMPGAMPSTSSLVMRGARQLVASDR